MRLHLTDNRFNTNPYWTERVKSIFACPPKEVVSMFDQNGYDLTRLEQLYAVANGANTTILFRALPSVEWCGSSAASELYKRQHINHAYMFERKGYSGDALAQLEAWSYYRPHFHKLIAMRPKWGLDFSIDYCDCEGNVFELLHWEYDGFDYNEVADKKEKMDEFLQNQDWDERAQTMLERKNEWHKLGFFEQSEWKTEFFGIEKERFKMVLWK